MLSAGVPLLGSSGFDYVYIPVISTLGVILLGLVLRWSHSGKPRGSRVADPSQGLLIGVAAAAPAEAERLRQLLTDAGLRTTSRQVGSRQQVLVWPDDVDTALRVLAQHR